VSKQKPSNVKLLEPVRHGMNDIPNNAVCALHNWKRYAVNWGNLVYDAILPDDIDDVTIPINAVKLVVKSYDNKDTCLTTHYVSSNLPEIAWSRVFTQLADSLAYYGIVPLEAVRIVAEFNVEHASGSLSLWLQPNINAFRVEVDGGTVEVQDRSVTPTPVEANQLVLLQCQSVTGVIKTLWLSPRVKDTRPGPITTTLLNVMRQIEGHEWLKNSHKLVAFYSPLENVNLTIQYVCKGIGNIRKV